MTQAPFLSIVAPCHNEEEGLREFCRRAAAAAHSVAGDAFELILVDDGSSDRTWEIISDLAADVPQLLGVRLLRNHGHQLASTAGLSASRGERVLLIDADLQDPPELLLMMMPIMERGADVVYGQRTRRQGETWFKLASASLFYRALSKLASVTIPRDTGDFRLMRRRVVDILLAMPERDRFIRGMVSWIGGRQVGLPYERDARFAGTTKYPLRKMINFALDAITSFSTTPLRISTWLGMMSAGVAIALLVYTFVRWLQGETVTGWSSIMAAVSAFSAIQLICIGIIGEYLGRLVQESKKRPMFMVETIVRGSEHAELSIAFSEMSASDKRAALDAAFGSEEPPRSQKNSRIG
ncbi:glycosyltransferase family 2 protein [Rhizobium leguminosarum]|uniref:glycosyltransferase family 2 protein n=1 Tax=Rhizobium leguminosarum TaxID=384 RepID=UPI001C96E104|nr:glycosyltransferase family 2 protein [Rhizobium leguminosarum]MBY5538897.1 glycosyltransferase family 2 protein [Rhizobium leguminosarum]MBY5581498.1 glycosyltransferase family 2 protein [Rhizobium leguminosarum]MBY5647384.1 glycosyltransferase family 2 protein [Rhizobium leguminosarum]MBY5660883.1 glycosyltransferase family 2 protein [Rhizobium leguminosarum]MBY5674919.1 glycosyltransferase family 2 protein [Rhizobium leguminosarum]